MKNNETQKNEKQAVQKANRDIDIKIQTNKERKDKREKMLVALKVDQRSEKGTTFVLP